MTLHQPTQLATGKLDISPKMDKIDNMETTNATDAKQQFGKLLDKVQHGPVMITSWGREVAVLVPAAQYRRDQEAKRALLMQRLNTASEQVRAGNTRSFEETEAEALKVFDQ